MDQITARIITNEKLTEEIYQLVFYSPELIEQKPVPGQFLHVRVSEHLEPLLRRPISIHDIDHHLMQCTLIYRVGGKGTQFLREKREGDSLDILGPLGNGFPMEEINEGEQVVLLGGGVGIPPLYYLAKELVKKEIPLTILLGYNSKEHSFLIKKFSQVGEVNIATMDGTEGIKGTVVDLITDYLNEKLLQTGSTFYACGPTPMLKAIQNEWLDTPINGYLSLEERMGCGIGACYGCVIKVDTMIDPKGYKKICQEGPVFSFREVLL